MSTDSIRKLAEMNNKGDSKAMLNILECAMSEDEARFILELPAQVDEVAAKLNLTEKEANDKILDLARRGLLVLSRKGYRYPRDPGTLHDNILSSLPQYIPEGIEKLWMKLYEGEQWWREIGETLASYGLLVLRAIPAEKSISPNIELLPHESMTKIIEENHDLISVRNCCCRVGAKKCHNPVDVCIQFKRRAEYDIYRSSGRKVSADEAVSVALKAVGSGLVPTVTNVSVMDNLEFICFCCGDCCMVLDPLLRLQKVFEVVAPSRFEAKINPEKCNGCRHCVPRCQTGAIDMKPVAGEMKAVIDPDKCTGCGVCALSCVPDAIIMEEVRGPEFIPETIAGPSAIIH
ncbi:MAG: 4Fe-4S binding protein [Dehalococcoidia bacterium]